MKFLTVSKVYEESNLGLPTVRQESYPLDDTHLLC
jgi:hypothetical protein